MDETSGELSSKQIETHPKRIVTIQDLPHLIDPPRLRPQDFPVPGIGGTNEEYDSPFYEEVRRVYRPDGYIYGPGAGNIFTMIAGFSPDTPPKGIVITDFNPIVILAAKIYVDGFKTYDAWGREFIRHTLNIRNLKAVAAKVIGEESDPNLRAVLERVDVRQIEEANAQTARRRSKYPSYDLERYPFDDRKAFDIQEFVPIAMIARNYALFRDMARAERISVICGDLFNPDILKLIGELPDFKDSNNVIYLSNTAETSIPIEEREKENPRFQRAVDRVNTKFRQLSVLEPNPPHKNVYIKARPYNHQTPITLEAGFQVPQVVANDLFPGR